MTYRLSRPVPALGSGVVSAKTVRFPVHVADMHLFDLEVDRRDGAVAVINRAQSRYPLELRLTVPPNRDEAYMLARNWFTGLLLVAYVG